MTADLRTAYWFCAKRELYFIRIALAWKVQCYSERSSLPYFNRIVRDPGFYARPKRFPRPGVKHVRKMISGVTEVLDQP